MTTDTTKVRWMITYHISLSFAIWVPFIEAFGRWIEEMATTDAATFGCCRGSWARWRPRAGDASRRGPVSCPDGSR
jgi:hypothetical protein